MLKKEKVHRGFSIRLNFENSMDQMVAKGERGHPGMSHGEGGMFTWASREGGWIMIVNGGEEWEVLSASGS